MRSSQLAREAGRTRPLPSHDADFPPVPTCSATSHRSSAMCRWRTDMRVTIQFS